MVLAHLVEGVNPRNRFEYQGLNMTSYKGTFKVCARSKSVRGMGYVCLTSLHVIQV